MGYRFIFGVAIYAVGMALFFANSGFSLPSGNAAIPVSLAFGGMGILSGAVAITLKRQEDRIVALERQLAAGRGGE